MFGGANHQNRATASRSQRPYPTQRSQESREPVGFVATILGDSEVVVRRHYSKWISERQNAVDDAIRATW